MTRHKLPKYVQGWVDREGWAHCYFRRAGYPRVRLPGLPWSPPFMAAYGYGDDWTLAAEPHISPAHGSEFVRRSVELRRDNQSRERR